MDIKMEPDDAQLRSLIVPNQRTRHGQRTGSSQVAGTGQETELGQETKPGLEIGPRQQTELGQETGTGQTKPGQQAGPGGQQELDDGANLDNATFIQDLLEVVPYLTNLDEFIGQFVRAGSKQDVAEILGFLDDETISSFIDTLRTKVAQLDGIRIHLRKNPDFPNRDLLEELLEDAQPKCRQTAESVARLRCSLAAASAGNNDTCNDGDDKDDDENDNDPSDEQQQQESQSMAVASYTTFLETGERQKQEDSMETSSLLMDSADLRSLPHCERELDDHDEVEKEDTAASDDVGAHIACSVGDNSSFTAATGALSVTDDWRQSTVQQDPKQIKIRREQLLGDCIDFYESVSRSNLRRIVSVKFVGEPGIDMGALTREFFSLGFEAFASSTFKNQSLFEGQRGHLLPDPGADCRVFSYLGRMIVHAVVNDCRAMPGLSPAIVHYLTNSVKAIAIEDSHPSLSIDDVADPQLNPILHKLDSAEELTREEQSSLETWMTESNCRIFLSGSAASRMMILQHLLIHYVFTKRLRQIEALAAGLSYLGLGEFLAKNRTKKNVSFVFPSPDDVSITDGALLASVVTRGDPPAQSGGDVSVLDLFVQFIKELHNSQIAGYGLVDLVQFMTGSPYPPHRIVVSFRSDNWQLPMAHVCYNEIQLPTIHRTYDEFRRAMTTALSHGSSGFDMD